jgi:hypothetical protein
MKIRLLDCFKFVIFSELYYSGDAYELCFVFPGIANNITMTLSCERLILVCRTSLW